MSQDSFTEVTQTGWGGRIKNAIGGIVVGLVLFGGSFAVLFWNEGRAVTTAKTLAEGESAVVAIPVDKVNPANEKKLVHLTGPAKTDEVLTDVPFAVSVNAIKLIRRAEMYQWRESQRTETEKHTGGGETKRTTYTYSKEWSDTRIESGDFKHPEGHANPSTMPFESLTLAAKAVTLGEFKLSWSVIAKISNADRLVLTDADFQKLPADVKAKARVTDGMFYIPVGGGGGDPQVGDVRVRFEVVQAGPISVIARQIGSTFEPYIAKTTNPIELVSAGTHSAEEMFRAEERSNTIWTWVLRLVGWAMMFFGILLVTKPISVLADFIPFFGRLVGAGLGFIAFFLSLALSLLAIAIAWIYYRPVLGILLLAGVAAVIAAGIFAAVKLKGRAKVQPASGAGRGVAG